MIDELCHEIFDQFLEEVGDYPSGDPEDDYNNFKKFHNTNFEKYPRLESCFSKKVRDELVDVLVVMYDDQNLTMEQFENKPIIKSYFKEFKNLNLKEEFESIVDPDSDIDNVPGGGGIDDGENVKYKRFLSKEPVSHLKMLLKQAGYKGCAKMSKSQLISLVLKEVNA